MDFEFSEDQRLLQETVQRVFADRYGDLAARHTAQTCAGGFDRVMWSRLAELGVLAIPFAERHGGLGHGPVETMIVAEAIGASLAVDPFIPTIVLAGAVIGSADDETITHRVVPGIVSGQRIVAVAALERQSRFDLFDVRTTARQTGDGSFVLEGAKTVALAADHADELIVSARLSGDRRDRDGIGLFLVDASAAGVARRGYFTQDGLRAADVTLSGVRVSPDRVIAPPPHGLDLLERAVDRAIAALCAEAVGAMAALHALTLDYLKTRKQFGVPIGSFQVLQHKAVDMLTAIEQARSMACYAGMMVEDAARDVRSRAISAAKVQIGRSARLVGETATQLHGGIGMTAEYRGGHYYKRLVAIDLTFGDADHHLARLAGSGGLDLV